MIDKFFLLSSLLIILSIYLLFQLNDKEKTIAILHQEITKTAESEVSFLPCLDNAKENNGGLINGPITKDNPSGVYYNQGFILNCFFSSMKGK